MKICVCSIGYCRHLLPVKILVMTRPLDSTLESATGTFGRQFKKLVARQPRTVVLANEIFVTWSIAVKPRLHQARAPPEGLQHL